MTEYEINLKARHMQREMLKIQKQLEQKDTRNLDSKNPEYIGIFIEQWLKDLADIIEYLR